LGARGLVRPGGRALQVVLGPEADQVAGDIRAALAAGPLTAAPSAGLIEALGGRANLIGIEPRSTRPCLALASTDAADRERLAELAPRGFAFTAPLSLHLLTGPGAEVWAERLRSGLAGA